MNIAAVQQLIQRAQQHEASTGQLAEQMRNHLDQLHPSIRLPNSDTDGVLLRFVSAYIEQVPELLQAAQQVAREAGIEAQIKPVLKVAEQFFLQPPALMAGHEGLEGLLDEAYLAHRLVEEVLSIKSTPRHRCVKVSPGRGRNTGSNRNESHPRRDLGPTGSSALAAQLTADVGSLTSLDQSRTCHYVIGLWLQVVNLPSF